MLDQYQLSINCGSNDDRRIASNPKGYQIYYSLWLGTITMEVLPALALYIKEVRGMADSIMNHLQQNMIASEFK
jgi:hypothetical protein